MVLALSKGPEHPKALVKKGLKKVKKQSNGDWTQNREKWCEHRDHSCFFTGLTYLDKMVIFWQFIFKFKI